MDIHPQLPRLCFEYTNSLRRLLLSNYKRPSDSVESAMRYLSWVQGSSPGWRQKFANPFAMVIINWDWLKWLVNKCTKIMHKSNVEIQELQSFMCKIVRRNQQWYREGVTGKVGRETEECGVLEAEWRSWLKVKGEMYCLKCCWGQNEDWDLNFRFGNGEVLVDQVKGCFSTETIAQLEWVQENNGIFKEIM